MFGLLKKDVGGAGTVYFRGNIPPRPEEFASLRRQGYELGLAKEPTPNAHWRMKLRHPEYGDAEAICLRDLPPPPEFLIEHDFGLSKSEKEEAKAAGTGVSIKVPARRKNVLRDRKNLLRFLRAVLGEDGVIAADHGSQRFWSRAALDEELAHDADLDVDSLCCFHAIMPEGGGEDAIPHWLHSHGLAELGAFDYDVLNPSEDTVGGSGVDALRAISFAILEGRLAPEQASMQIGAPRLAIRTVPAATFQKTAAPEHAALRDSDESHTRNRSVICEPAGGLLSRLSGGRPRPSRFLSSPFPEAMMVMFTDAATELMAQRARATAGVLRRLHEELARFEFPTIVKLGIETDAGGGDREHMWFEVHSVGESAVDATLSNQPFHVSRMQQGDRAEHSLELLTDWAIMTPFGQINPRSQTAARMIREHPELLGMMAAIMGGGGEPG